MLDEDRPSPFFSICFYAVVDIAFWIFVTLYMVGDVDHQDNFLKYLRAIPAWLIVVELFTLRVTHCGMWTVFLAFIFYSIGDWLFIFRHSDDPYAAGLFFYMIGHGLIVTSIGMFIRGAVKREGGIKKHMGSYKVFTIILVIVLGLTIISIIAMVVNLVDKFEGYVVGIVALLGITMVAVVMTGVFYFFACYKISTELYWGSLETMAGTVLIYIGNHFLIHGKYDQFYIDRVSGAANVYLEMIPYYMGLYFMGKGFFNTARFFSLLDSKQVGPKLYRRGERDKKQGSQQKTETNPAGESANRQSNKGSNKQMQQSNPQRKQRFGSDVRLQNNC